MKQLNLLSIKLILALSLCYSITNAQQTIPLDSAKHYEGKTVTICTKVQGTHITKGDKKTTYINFGRPFPDNTFTAVIFEKELPNFKYIPSEYLKDKQVCLTGLIKIYKEKPQMVLESESQIKTTP